MAETKSIYEAIGRNLSDIAVKGVPTSATGSTFDSNVLFHPQSTQLRGKEVYIYSGQGAGQARTIATFAPANNRCYIEPHWTTIPTNDSKFIIFDHFRTEDYESSVNRMMGMARMKYLEDKVATMQLAGSQYAYCVPSGFEWVSSLRLVPSGHSDYEADDEVDRIFEIAPRFFRIEPNAGGSYLIIIDPRKISIDANLDEEWVHVVGQVKPDFAATTVPEELEEFIIAGASMLMAAQRMNENQEWRSKFYMFRDFFKPLEDYIYRYGRGKKVK